MKEIIFFLEAIFSELIWFSFPGRLLTFKKNRKLFGVLIFCVYIAENIFQTYNSDFHSSFIKTILYFGQYLIFILVAYKEDWKTKLFCYSIFVLSIVLSEICVMAFLGLFNVEEVVETIYEYQYVTYICTAVFSYFINLLLSFFYSKLRKKRFSNKSWELHLVIFSQFLMIFIMALYLYSNGYEKIPLNNLPVCILTIFLVGISIIVDICLYRILVSNAKNFELKNELEISQTKSNLEQEYYAKLKKNIDATRKMNHDFNNILTVIQNMILSDTPENKQLALKTVEELKETLAKNKIRNYCKNEFVNLIIISKAEDIVKDGIDFSANLNLPQDLSIKNSDLCRIITNLLDNAKEACEMSHNKDKCFIVLSSQISGDVVCITCENYYDSEIKSKNDRFISLKENHKGLGIEIIKEIAKSYDGSLECSYENNIFSAAVTLKNA